MWAASSLIRFWPANSDWYRQGALIGSRPWEAFRCPPVPDGLGHFPVFLITGGNNSWFCAEPVVCAFCKGGNFCKGKKRKEKEGKGVYGGRFLFHFSEFGTIIAGRGRCVRKGASAKNRVLWRKRAMRTAAAGSCFDQEKVSMASSPCFLEIIG